MARARGESRLTRTRGAQRVVRSALHRFMFWSAATLVLLVAGSVVVGSTSARHAALNQARMQGATIADSLVAPLVDRAVRAGDREALSRMDRAMQARMADGELTRVKVWSRDGHILWSDESELIGRRFTLEEDVVALFGTRRATAELSDLSKAENVRERAQGELLEVYAGVVDADSEPVVFEAYLSTDQMHSDQRRIVLDILPLAIGGLFLFQAAILPLAVSLARRVREGEAQRIHLMRQALMAVNQERRQIAEDLHDGVIQDLAGIGYALPEVDAHLPDTREAAGAREVVHRATEVLRRDVAALRSMLVDIYPPDLAGPGLGVAVRDLAHQAQDGGVQVAVVLRPMDGVSLDASRLAYRIVREGLRNVVKHAGASRAVVIVETRGEQLVVQVSDDGVGIEEPLGPSKGHVGLLLLGDTLAGFGGSLVVRRAQPQGTVLTAVFWADLTDGRSDLIQGLGT